MSRECVVWIMDDDPFHTFIPRFNPRTFNLLATPVGGEGLMRWSALLHPSSRSDAGSCELNRCRSRIDSPPRKARRLASGMTVKGEDLIPEIVNRVS